MSVTLNVEVRLWFPGSNKKVVLVASKLLGLAAYWERVIHAFPEHGVLESGVT